VRRLLHGLKHRSGLVGGESRIQQGKIDFLLFGEVQLENGIEAVEHPPQRLHLGVARPYPRQVRPQDAQLAREQHHLLVIADHRGCGIRRTHRVRHGRIQRALLRLSMRNQVVRQELVDRIQVVAEDVDGHLAGGVGQDPQELDLWQQCLVLRS